MDAHHIPHLKAILAAGPPADYVLDLDAQALTGFSDEDTVSSWPDLSGNGNGAVGGAGTGDDPKYNLSGINGRPSVRFNGDSALLSPYDGLPRADAVATFFAVLKVTSTSTGYTWHSDGAQITLASQGFSALILSGNFSVNLGGVFNSVSAASVLNVPIIVSVAFDKNSATRAATVRINGSQIGTSIGGSSSTEPLRIAARGADASVPGYMEAGAFRVYERWLTAGEIEATEKYLSQRWGNIPLTGL